MANSRKHENEIKRLAKAVSKNKERSRSGRPRKSSVRPKPVSHARGKMARERGVSPLIRLVGALRSEKIRFQLIGMSAAVLQGVPVVTHDVDLWIDLPARQYMRAINVAAQLGAEMIRNTVVELSNGLLVNFIYEVTGLGDFATELRKAKRLKLNGCSVPVMPLESIRKSKKAIMREKDSAHIHYITETLRLQRRAK
jgi:hypothetical protein